MVEVESKMLGSSFVPGEQLGRKLVWSSIAASAFVIPLSKFQLFARPKVFGHLLLRSRWWLVGEVVGISQ